MVSRYIEQSAFGASLKPAIERSGCDRRRVHAGLTVMRKWALDTGHWLAPRVWSTDKSLGD